MLKSRKKMLLSSVAMLLVALVALGSATYAWYITNARVDASQTQFSAASADGLVIRHGTSGEWSNKITDLKHAESLTPGAFNYNVSNPVYATGEGTSFTDGTLKGDLRELTGNDIAGAFLLDTFYVASSGTSSVEAKMYVTCSTVNNTYLNIAIFVDGVLQEVLTSDEEATATGKITSTTGTTPVAYTANGQNLTAMGSHQINNVDTNKDTFTATVKGTGESGCKVQIVAFVDGFNPKCKNKTANITAANVDYYFTT